MNTFTPKTSELYGAKNAGYQFDRNSAREVNEEIVRKLTAERGERFVADKLDSLYDFDGDLFVDASGVFFAVVMVNVDSREVPLCWQQLKRIWYAVQRDREDDWGTGSYDLAEAKRMAREQLAEYPDTLIAVIENGNYCADEITDFED